MFPVLAGALEFSTADIVILILIVLALVLALPLLAGTIAVMLYRRRTAEDDRSRHDAVVVFLKWALIVFVVQFALQQLVRAFS